MKKHRNTFHVRSANLNDLNDVTKLVTACDMAEWGLADFSKEELLEIWNSIPLNTNSFIVSTITHQIVGYGFLEETTEGRIDCYGFVDPRWRGKGIGSLLMKSFQNRASYYIKRYEQVRLMWTFNIIIPAKNKTAISLLEKNEFSFSRQHSKMCIHINSPQQNTLHSMLQLRPFNTQSDWKLLFNLYNHCFKDTREYTPLPFDKWIIKKTSKEEYDQDLWYIAYLNNEPAGFVICKKSPDEIWIDLLGVKGNMRNQGIGTALLKQIFHDCFLHKVSKVQLWVDSDSLTNANLLYEKLGMKAIYQVAVFSKIH